MLSKTHIFYHEDDTVSLCGQGDEIIMDVNPDGELCQQCIVRIHPFTERQRVEKEWRDRLQEVKDESD